MRCSTLNTFVAALSTTIGFNFNLRKFKPNLISYLIPSRIYSVSLVKAVAMSTFSYPNMSYIDSDAAKDIDLTLMSTPGFSIDQLMELAGLSVASAATDFVSKNKNSKILILCGPGNNGGDGLVAARHLKHFGYHTTIVYPKPSLSTLFLNLIRQVEDLDIPVIRQLPAISNYDAIIDSFFGFSFVGPVREPFLSIISEIKKYPEKILSVDVPSGWDINLGDIYSTQLLPAAVISLTAPKLCMKDYKGIHYLGGRFIPPAIAKQYNLYIPNYIDTEQYVRLPSLANTTTTTTTCTSTSTTAVTDTYNITSSTELLPSSTELLPSSTELLPSSTELLPSSTELLLSTDPLVVMFSTTSSIEEAKKIASVLLQLQLVACVNILPGATSMYTWKNKIEESQEFLMIIKTKKSHLEAVTSRIKEYHSYEVPESIALEIIGGNEDYLKWLKDSIPSSTSTTATDNESI